MARRQRVSTTRTQQFGAELSDGLEHLRSAATIAAEGAAGAVAPRVDTAREMIAPRIGTARDAMAPRVAAARQVVGRSWDSTVHAAAPVVSAAADSARHATDEARKRAGRAARKAGSAAGRSRRRRWPWIVGAVAVGVAAGTIGILISRRNRPEWEEYEPEHQFAEGARDTGDEVTDAVPEQAESRPDPAAGEHEGEAPTTATQAAARHNGGPES